MQNSVFTNIVGKLIIHNKLFIVTVEHNETGSCDAQKKKRPHRCNNRQFQSVEMNANYF